MRTRYSLDKKATGDSVSSLPCQTVKAMANGSLRTLSTISISMTRRRKREEREKEGKAGG